MAKIFMENHSTLFFFLFKGINYVFRRNVWCCIDCADLYFDDGLYDI